MMCFTGVPITQDANGADAVRTMPDVQCAPDGVKTGMAGKENS
jgi:hypothetical protein